VERLATSARKCYYRTTPPGILDYRKRVILMTETYLIDTWYIQYADGTLVPCQNRATAEYLVNIGDAERIVDVTRELMKK
jgi:hypothetical protein